MEWHSMQTFEKVSVSQSVCTILHSHQKYMSEWSSFFFTDSPAFDVVPIFYFSHSDWCVMISFYGFNLHFLNIWAQQTSFHVFPCHQYFLFGKKFNVFCPFSNWLFFCISFFKFYFIVVLGRVHCGI
jgi:hypothetical protein